ncbi:hypothetical protein J7L49_06685 [Candidatus Bathyarchaeota archaeon]|nr:hypothetical protein [Candidatus Bathyarchaeota archaeon]
MVKKEELLKSQKTFYDLGSILFALLIGILLGPIIFLLLIGIGSLFNHIYCTLYPSKCIAPGEVVAPPEPEDYLRMMIELELLEKYVPVEVTLMSHYGNLSEVNITSITKTDLEKVIDVYECIVVDWNEIEIYPLWFYWDRIKTMKDLLHPPFSGGIMCKVKE